MARIAAATRRRGRLLSGADMSTKLKLLGSTWSFGDAQGARRAVRAINGPTVRSRFTKIVVSQDGKALLGGVLVGMPATMPRCCR